MQGHGILTIVSFSKSSRLIIDPPLNLGFLMCLLYWVACVVRVVTLLAQGNHGIRFMAKLHFGALESALKLFLMHVVFVK